MKTKLSITLTVLLMMICVSVTAQSGGALNGYTGKSIVSNTDGIASAIMRGSYQSDVDQNGDNKVNAVDIVRYVNMTSVNIKIKNNTSAAISLSPRVKFVLSSKSTDAAWLGAPGSVISINSNDFVEFKNVLIPNSKNLIGQTFANDSELEGLSSNVILYDTPENGWNSTTIVPGKMDPSIKFEAGNNYEISIGSNSSSDPAPVNPQPTTDNVTASVTIVNNSGTAKTFDGKICFITYGSYPAINYTGHFTVVGTCSGASLTIPASGRQTYTVTFAKDDNQTPTVALGMPFASQGQLVGYSSNNGLYINNTFTACTNISTSTTFAQGGQYTMTIPGSGSTVDPTPVDPTPTQPTTGSVTTTVTMVNNSGAAVTFDGKVCFLTYGTYSGYTGYFTVRGTCSGASLTIPASGRQTYTVTFAKDNSQTPTVALGMPFASAAQIASSSYGANNGYYVNNVFTACTNISTSTTFSQGGQYTMTIPGSGSTVDPTPVDPTPTQPTTGSVTTTVTMVNNSGSAKTFDGRVCFITYGTYSGYTGYFRIKGTCSGASLTIPAGGRQTYTITFEKNDQQTPSVAVGMHFASQAQRAQFQSNNGYYINGSCYTCNDFSTNDTFRNGGQYTMVIPADTHEWSSSSTATPTQPTTGSVTTTVTMVNNSGSAKTFDGRVCFITYGTYSGYTGYFRIKGTCSGASLTIPAGGRQTYTITFEKNDQQTPSVAVGMHFASQAQRAQFQSNNGYYINGSCYTCNDFSTNDTFRNGGQYTMVIPANTHEWSSSSTVTPVNPTPTAGSVTTTVTMVNNSGSAKTFDGRVCFITYGTYSGYTGYFRIKGTCSGASLTIPAGGRQTYTITFEKNDQQTPSVAVGMHFASQAQRAQFQSNNGYYINGSCYTCNDFSTNDTFRNGGQYTMVIPANTHEWSSSSSTPSTSGSSVTTTVTIVNNSRAAKTFDGRVCFITYGTYSGYTGYFRIKGNCSGASFTIPAGGRQTYTITFPKNDQQTPSVAVGMHFASQAQRAQFQSNNGYYINGSCYTCNDFSTNDTFRNGGQYTMVIPANTHEWSSN